MGDRVVKCSVIMPVKNGFQYIEKSIQSVLEQSFSDWELIIVNDASTDRTEEVVQKFLADKRIRYISCTQSVGVGMARNIGLDEVKGRYVIFLDCDDCLLEDSIKNRIEEIKEYSADFGYFGSFFRKGKEIKEKPAQCEIRGGVCTNKEFLSRISEFQAGKVVGIEYVWDKIFDFGIIKEQNIRFDVKRNRYEDIIFVMDYLRCLSHKRNRILISATYVYEYHIHQDSVSSLYDPQMFEKTRSCFQYIKSNLLYYGIFKGRIAEGYYHGYINKMIGQVIAYRNRGEQGEFEKYLSEDADFLEGLRRYEIRNQHETTEILNMLREIFL